jgi:hypothetical protein
MSTLSSKGRDLVLAGRRAYQPTTSDRERLFNSLQARLGGSVLPPDLGVVAPVASRTLWWLLPAVIVSVGLVGGTLYLKRPKPAPAREAMVATVISTMPEDLPVAPPAAAPPPAVPDRAPTATTARPPLAKRRDQLAAEVAILSRATHDLRAGYPAEALKALDEYCRRFPKGLLNDEQQAARAQSLCGLGRFDEAKRKIARLSEESPLAIRARQFCDAKLAAR